MLNARGQTRTTYKFLKDLGSPSRSTRAAAQPRMQPKRDKSRGTPLGGTRAADNQRERNNPKSREIFLFLRPKVSSPEFPLHLSLLG